MTIGRAQSVTRALRDTVQTWVSLKFHDEITENRRITVHDANDDTVTRLPFTRPRRDFTENLVTLTTDQTEVQGQHYTVKGEVCRDPDVLLWRADHSVCAR